MNVARDITVLRRMTVQDDNYVEASPAERAGFVWELTAELWSLRDEQRAERRLQRDVTNLIKQ
ncbi:MAG TPA: hypothetical protein VMW16_15380 [Sedimentisphaerales bacterium]|nr:hypothetical protein [Sedimentisphaerales bacterium]